MEERELDALERIWNTYSDINHREESGELFGDALERELRNIVEDSIEMSAFYTAMDAARKLDDRALIRRAAEGAMNSPEWGYEALTGFKLLGDRNGFFRAFRKMEARGEEQEIDLGTYLDLGERDTRKRISEGFEEWKRERGYQKAAADIFRPRMINMAYHLAGRYDVGVGIAKGGLSLTYILGLYGLRTVAANAHVRGRDKPVFRWLDKGASKEISGRKVLVVDNDVIDGGTSQLVLDRLQRYEPERVDIALVHDLRPGKILCKSNSDKVPQGFSKAYCPDQFNYSSFQRAVKKLEDKLKDVE